MKKDIDLLGGFIEAKDKKSSNSSSLIMVVGVLIIIGVVLFMFVSAKMEISEKEEIIKGLDNQLSQEGYVSAMEQKIEADKARYKGMITEIVKEVNSGKVQGNAAEISDKILEVLYDNYANKKDAEGNPEVKIDFITVDSAKLSMRCSVRTYQDAWDFIDYLRGTLEIPAPAEGASDAEVKAYEEKKAAIEANATYFSGVIESYPGLPAEGDGKEYTIGLALNFDVNWGALVDHEAN